MWMFSLALGDCERNIIENEIILCLKWYILSMSDVINNIQRDYTIIN